jgi:hypothetical protein
MKLLEEMRKSLMMPEEKLREPKRLLNAPGL